MVIMTMQVATVEKQCMAHQKSQCGGIHRNPVLSTCISMMDIQMPGEEQCREVLTLLIEMLHGWGRRREWLEVGDA